MLYILFSSLFQCAPHPGNIPKESVCRIPELQDQPSVSELFPEFNSKPVIFRFLNQEIINNYANTTTLVKQRISDPWYGGPPVRHLQFLIYWRCTSRHLTRYQLIPSTLKLINKRRSRVSDQWYGASKHKFIQTGRKGTWFNICSNLSSHNFTTSRVHGSATRGTADRRSGISLPYKPSLFP